jgi:hypothetical protein
MILSRAGVACPSLPKSLPACHRPSSVPSLSHGARCISNTLCDRYQSCSARCGLLCSGSLRCPRHGGFSRLSYMLLAFPALRGSEILKEGFRGFPFREVINEAMPVVEPMLPCSRDKRGSAVFHCVHRPHCLIPPQRTSKRKPEMGIQERFCHWDDEGRIIVFSRPHRIFAVSSHIIGFYAVRAVYMVSPFSCFGHSILNRHIFPLSPLTSSSGEILSL